MNKIGGYFGAENAEGRPPQSANAWSQGPAAGDSNPEPMEWRRHSRVRTNSQVSFAPRLRVGACSVVRCCTPVRYRLGSNRARQSGRSPSFQPSRRRRAWAVWSGRYEVGQVPRGCPS